MKKILFFAAILLISCDDSHTDSVPEYDYKQEMRDFVIGISQYAKAENPNFAIIPQNGIELVTEDGEATGNPAAAYLNAIDGNGQEDFLYGYDADNIETPSAATIYFKSYLDVSKAAGNTVLAIDYCSTPSKMGNSYTKNNTNGYISFAAIERNLNVIPGYPVFHENAADVGQLSQAKNFLYLINAENFNSKGDFINAVKATNYDAVIMDLYFNDGTAFTAAEIQQLKEKANGGKRIVICYMSIGEAEDYRYYWQNSWLSDKPDWLTAENPDWPGNYKVKYWNADWQQIIYGNDNSYLKKILDASFDGVYLDIIDAFEYFESR
ncbi:endo alpha-1,4 polygalactosaminidase [Flavobacterium pallidum]|uniref:Glycoside-hydrolase family GH114 TIM-barrel domain-containing protein n=1 Tax=Flavobacterium pallidum TaxID=2172098 RepID=A0A2S1SJ59_9FLAO|nr:endo alpha-1,4 polygalactosaminidase [Flavobacterium pallidum]AWI26448.1 hypothetical protein HYN49_11345 [Flavobacterium pallidum]